MSLHDCKHEFLQMASHVFPEYMKVLETSIKKPIAATEFLANYTTDYKHPFRGCYVFIKNGKPIYVGISRTVFKRLKIHLTAKTHNGSSFTFKIAKGFDKTLKGKDKKKQHYKDAFEKARGELSKCKIAWVPIENALEAYLFEAYACMQLGTTDYNSFETS